MAVLDHADNFDAAEAAGMAYQTLNNHLHSLRRTLRVYSTAQALWLFVREVLV